MALRFTRRWGPHRIAFHLHVPRSTVGRVLGRYRMPLLSHLDQATGLPVRAPRPVRYEVDQPGQLVHVDIKKLGRIPDGGGHRMLGRLAILTATGQAIDTAEFSTTKAGMARAIAWAARRTGGDLAALRVIECTATFGAQLAAAVAGAGYQVLEAPRMDACAHRGVGKSDPLDAQRIAAATLPLEEDQVRRPRRGHGERAALRVLVAARDHMASERTAAVNALTALVRVGVDARRPLSSQQIREIGQWRTRNDPVDVSMARAEAVRLAKRIAALDEDLASSKDRMETLVRATPAAGLLDKTGIGPVTAAVCLTVWSHHGRVHSETAFASLAGVNPIPASSGNTIRHRLNRGGDRRLNRALHMATVTRMTHVPITREYVERRRAEGRTTQGDPPIPEALPRPTDLPAPQRSRGTPFDLTRHRRVHRPHTGIGGHAPSERVHNLTWSYTYDSRVTRNLHDRCRVLSDR